MDAALRQDGTGALKSYSPARYVYLLESLTALADHLTAARAQTGNSAKVGVVERFQSIWRKIIAKSRWFG